MNKGRFLVLCGAASAVLLFSTLLQRPIPAFIHDWNWPPDQASLGALLSRGWSAWDPSDLGRPNAYISAFPHYAVLWLLAKALPSAAVLWILLFTIWIAGMLGAAWLARRALDLPARWALVAGVLYMAGPVTLGKLVAGHLPFLQAYALLPWFVAAALRADRDRTGGSTVLAALFAALTAVQIQLYGFELYILALLTILRRLRPARALTIVALSVPGILPQIVGSTLLQHGVAGQLAMQHAVLGWEQQQSAPRLAAFEGRGYFTQYYEQLAPSWLLHWLLLFPGFAIAALVLGRARRLSIFLILIALSGWLVATALRNPLGPAFAYAFVHFSAASVYRELYDAMPLLWLTYAILAAALLAFMRPWHGAAGAALLLAIVLPAWIGLPRMFAPAPALREVAGAQALAPRDAFGYVIWWPSDQPIGPLGARGGTDPLEFTGAAHLLPLFEYEPTGSFAAAIDFGRSGDWRSATAILRSLGAVTLVDRKDLGSFHGSDHPTDLPAFHFVRETADLRKLGSTGPYDVYRIERPLGFASLEAVQRSAVRIPGEALPRSLVDFEPNGRDLVAAFPYYEISPVVAQCAPDAVLGFAPAYLKTSYPWFFAAPVTAKAACRWISRSEIARLPPETLIVAGRWSTHPWPSVAAQAKERETGSVTIERRSRTSIGGTYTAALPATLIVRMNFDPRWLLWVDGKVLHPEKSDGYANGWSVPAGTHRFIARFAPAVLVDVLLWACGLWIAGLALVAGVIVRRSR